MDAFRNFIGEELDANSLKGKLEAAYSDIKFLQQEHAVTIQGLHEEIERLQNMHRDLEFRIEVLNIPLESDFVKNSKKILDEKIDQLTQENDFLKRKMYENSHALDILDQKQKLLKWQHHQELEERDATIIRLQRELEIKCSTISHLTSQLHCRKKGSFLRRFSFNSEPPSLPPSSYSKAALARQSSSSRKADFHREANSVDLYESELDSLHCRNSSNSSFSDKSASDDDSIQRKSLSTTHNSLSYLENGCARERQSSDIKLPPINPPVSDSTRRLVRHQLRVDKLASKATSDPLAIDQVSSPELVLTRLNKAQ